jgi:phosphate transport system substrate-binding protein
MPARGSWLLLLVAALVTGCRSAGPAGGTIRITGSSTVFPFAQEAIRAYETSQDARGVTFQLQEVGTTAGLRSFCQGEVQIANASRPISSEELQRCRANGVMFIELPIAFDALTVVVNRKNAWATQITTRELNRLWGRAAQGRINRWSQVNLDWPEEAIKLCGPGDQSGSFDYFNKAINGSPTNSRSDYQSSEDDHVVVRCVLGDPRALGYFGFAYYKANTEGLKALAIVNGSTGMAVAPSVSAVQANSYMPLSRPLFLYVNDKELRQNDALRDFTLYTVGNGLSLVEKAGYIPLPSSTYQLVEAKLYNHVLGTSFGGDLPVGLSIGEALRRSFDENRRPGYR